MTQEDHDRLSVLLDDAHRALAEAWKITVYAGERYETNALVLADCRVLDVIERFGIVTEGVVERITAYSGRV